MRVAIPHDLDRQTVRDRLRANGHRIADHMPGGLADVTTTWPSADRMAMAITVMGQSLTGHVDIEERQLVIVVELPPALGFVGPLVEGAIRQQGHSLLAPPAG